MAATIAAKASTTSSLYIDYTLLSPDLEKLTGAVSTLIVSQIVDDPKIGVKLRAHPNLRYFCGEAIFEEDKSPANPEIKKAIMTKPTKDEVYKFLKCMCKHIGLRYFHSIAAALYSTNRLTACSPESIVVCTIYLGRVQFLSEVPLFTSNWRLLVLCATLIAHKVTTRFADVGIGVGRQLLFELGFRQFLRPDHHQAAQRSRSQVSRAYSVSSCE
ncbi:MAG: hypothetical protein P4M11_11015 [Candidatus Pacebacteria bacterium]|nr:hypothetical protein [Candidatus Paceibacterota bacterium]